MKRRILFLTIFFIPFLFSFIIYLNQSKGYFIFSRPELNDTYVSFRFDDGLKSQLKAFYFLKEKNMTGSVYIITSKPSSNLAWEKDYYLNWEEIKEISSFMEIGSHTKNHVDLIYSKNLEEEIVGSKKDLIDREINVTTFVYPGGNYNFRVITLVEENYDCASTQDVGTNSYPIRPHLLKDFTFRIDSDLNTARRVIKEGKWNILTFHDIGEVPLKEKNIYYFVAKKNSISFDLFKEIVEYVEKNNIKVISIKEGCEMFKNGKK